MNEVTSLLNQIATNPSVGVPIIGVLFAVTMLWSSRGDKSNDGKVLDIFGTFVSQSNSLGTRLESNTSALLTVEKAFQTFAQASQGQHATTRAHITKHEDDITRALEIFGNTQVNIVKELKKVAEITSGIFGQLSTIHTTTTDTKVVVTSLESKADKIIMTLETAQLGRIIELLENIRQETKDFYSHAQEENRKFFESTNTRLDNIEVQIKPILGEESNEQETKTDTPDSSDIRRVVRDAINPANRSSTGNRTNTGN